MSRHGWEHYDLGKEIANSNMAQLLELFKREDKKLTEKCIEYVDIDKKLNDEGKKQIERECNFLDEGRINIAMEIAERMTNLKKFQNEVRP